MATMEYVLDNWGKLRDEDPDSFAKLGFDPFFKCVECGDPVGSTEEECADCGEVTCDKIGECCACCDACGRVLCIGCYESNDGLCAECAAESEEDED